MAHTEPEVLHRALQAEFDALYRFSRRMGLSEADTEDALQEVALVCLKKQSATDTTVENPRAYLFGVMFKVATRIRDSARRRGGHAPLDDVSLPDSQATPEEALQNHDTQRLLDGILDTLSDDERAVLILCDIEEQTMAEVATHLDVAPGTVASRLRRARENFSRARTRLERRMHP